MAFCFLVVVFFRSLKKTSKLVNKNDYFDLGRFCDYSILISQGCSDDAGRIRIHLNVHNRTRCALQRAYFLPSIDFNYIPDFRDNHQFNTEQSDGKLLAEEN